VTLSPTQCLLGLLLLPALTALPADIPVSGNAVAGFESLDTAILASMQKYSIPGVTFAMTKGGRLIYARGYGYGDVETSTPVAPDSLFRLASVSKPLTATATDKLVATGNLSYSTPAFTVLNFLQPLPGQSEDARVPQITVGELEQHQSGWADDIGYNRYSDVPAAATALGLPLPGTFEGLIRYELGRPLDYSPGTQTQYCNFCYGVLAEAVQTAAGEDYETYVRKILWLAGLTQTRIGRHLKSGKFPEEVTYYTSPGTPLYPSLYADLPAFVPLQYGGTIIDWGTGSAAGGWISNTMELLRLVASVTLGQSPAMFTVPPRTGFAFSGLPIGLGWNWRHDGGIPGTSTTLHIYNDVAWCILTNTDYNGGDFINDVDSVVQTFALGNPTWPTGDLFPQYLPALAGHPAFFAGEFFVGSGTYQLQFSPASQFGYYGYLSSSILFHQDMGYEAFIPSTDGQIYFYDFSTGHWWYTSPSLFPYLYDFTLNTFIYYFPDTKTAGHYTTNPRYFSNLTTGQIFTM
jgi:CubicO group peptidase (beta-lactamase class C family)